ncbi:MAG: DNA topoisomerase (ATP-hydrolyzing) subunit A [Nitrospinaceae bacterium]
MATEKISDIQVELENRFLTYALSTIVSRSLPDVRDGLKPIHRRILFAMDNMGVTAAAKFVKSAKIIGEVLGKYHPHGDASTYESMVRMAQDFSMRYPLVDGKGNFGSIDGDAPAAYRYTEGRLTPITSFLLMDLKKDTVDFRQNYDNTLKEPVVLPSRIPNLLINGASGIAVGMACSFPSHNLGEVINALTALISQPQLTVTQMMKYIKGPDFPTGGIILNTKSEIRKAYEEGSGTIKIRGEWKIEHLNRGKRQIILTSIPYGVNKAKMIEKIAEIILGKKLPPLVDVRDESDEKMRVVLEIKSQSDPEKLMSYLFKHTDLESNFQLNFTCLKPNGEPDRLSLLEICRFFLDFRKDVVVRGLTHELTLIENRLHILDGFAAVFKNLDKALRIIRSCKSRSEAHDKLKKEFKLDDTQAKSILEIPLYRLVAMEIDKIITEQKEKLKEKKRLESILRSPKKIWNEVKEELEEIKRKFADKRQTSIKAIQSVDYNADDFIQHEDVVLVLSRKGWLRKLKSAGDPASLKFKENDGLLASGNSNTRNLIAFFTSRGMVYIQKIYNLPYTRGGFGEPIQNLFKFADGERVIHMLSLDSPTREGEDNGSMDTPRSSGNGGVNQFSLDFPDPDAKKEPAPRDIDLMAASQSGFGFRFAASILSETTRAGRKIMNLKSNDRMAGVLPVLKDYVFLASDAGKGLIIPIAQVSKLAGTGMGVKLMKITGGKLVGFQLVNLKDKVTLLLEDGKTRDIRMSKIPVYHRGSMGVIISKRKKIVQLI